MAPQADLQALLETIAPHVYFQPPLKLQYPCIIYKRDTSVVQRADNLPFHFTWGYQVTVIDHDPDSQITDQVKNLPMCEFRTNFVADGLNHDVFTLYF